jgi:hypothetical protein
VCETKRYLDVNGICAGRSVQAHLCKRFVQETCASDLCKVGQGTYPGEQAPCANFLHRVRQRLNRSLRHNFHRPPPRTAQHQPSAAISSVASGWLPSWWLLRKWAHWAKPPPHVSGSPLCSVLRKFLVLYEPVSRKSHPLEPRVGKLDTARTTHQRISETQGLTHPPRSFSFFPFILCLSLSLSPISLFLPQRTIPPSIMASSSEEQRSLIAYFHPEAQCGVCREDLPESTEVVVSK